MPAATHLALYRKYRPKHLAELVGQAHVARTLGNAIANQRLAHAYLFSGPRGTGKTSTARILAKSLNCVQGPTTTPCEACPSCVALGGGGISVDVIEIDAASNRGIDDIRELKERVRLAPVTGRFKVYIIDEVHMLTTEAFNALLKTLEEPPDNLIFVLATTEPHKVLPTIHSRCQRLDFQRIPMPLLTAHLARISELEAIPLDAEALEAIALRADGGLRDALSLLDQVATMAAAGVGGTDGSAGVLSALGVPPAQAVAEVGEALAARDPAGAVGALGRWLAAGFDAGTLLRELVRFLRHVLLLPLAPEGADALEVPAALREAVARASAAFPAPEALIALEILGEAEGTMRASDQAATWLELALIRVCRRAEVPSLEDLTRRVAALEAQLAGAEARPRPAVPARPPGAAPHPAAPAAHQPPPIAAPAPARVPVQAPVPTPVQASASPVANAAATAGAAVGAEPPPDEVSAPMALPEAAPGPIVDPGAASPVHQQAPDIAAAGPLSPDEGPMLWEAVKKLHRSTASLMEQYGRLISVESDRVVIGVVKSFEHYFQGATNRQPYLERAVAQRYGPGVKLEIRFEAPGAIKPTPAPRAVAPAGPLVAAAAAAVPAAPTAAPMASPPAVPGEPVPEAPQGAAPAPASPSSPPESAPLPEGPAAPPPAATAAREEVAASTGAPSPAAATRGPEAVARPAPPRPPAFGGPDPVSKVAEIFNGKIVDATP